MGKQCGKNRRSTAPSEVGFSSGMGIYRQLFPVWGHELLDGPRAALDWQGYAIWMANPEHVAMLAEGVDAWNHWRRDHLLIRPDLANADLHGNDYDNYDLREVDLSCANLRSTSFLKAALSSANLSGVDLCGATLSHTDLDQASFVGGNLQATQFTFANMHKADISGANGSGADFGSANMRFAILRGARLRGANFYDAVLCDADCTGADFTDADLQGALLLKSMMQSAILSGCRVYGTSVWDVALEGAIQSNLVITPKNQQEI
jgi:uncharacterized protein YjbI with pentapeptide repeats